MNIRNISERFNGFLYKLFNFYVSKFEMAHFKKKNKDLYREVSKNKVFKNKHNGEECYIVASGPSLKKQNLHLLLGKNVFTVNQIGRNDTYLNCGFASLYHFWSDSRFFEIDESRPEDIEMLEIIKKVNTNVSHPICFFKPSMKKTVDKYRLNEVFETRYYIERETFFSKYNKSPDFTKYIPCFSTVVHYCIWMALYMGFKKINILGCDTTGIISVINAKQNDSSFEYSYSLSENEKKRFARVANVNSIISETESYLTQLNHFKYIYDYCKKRGVQLFNVTEGGVLDFLPAKKLSDAVKE